MQSGERAHGIGAGVEDELGPLRAAGVGERDGIHAGLGEQRSELVDHAHGSVGRLEGANPGIALNVVSDVPGLDDAAGGKSSSANYVFHALGDELFVAHSVLNRADGAALVE